MFGETRKAAGARASKRKKYRDWDEDANTIGGQGGGGRRNQNAGAFTLEIGDFHLIQQWKKPSTTEYMPVTHHDDRVMGEILYDPRV